MEKLNTPPKHTQKALLEHLNKFVLQLDGLHFQGPEIAWVLKRTKGRISQILKEAKSNE